MVSRGRNHRCAPALIEEEVGENPNQPQQGKSDKRAEYADANRQQGDRYHFVGSSKVTQRLPVVVLLNTAHHAR